MTCSARTVKRLDQWVFEKCTDETTSIGLAPGKHPFLADKITMVTTVRNDATKQLTTAHEGFTADQELEQVSQQPLEIAVLT